MAWFKVDDALAFHMKVVTAGNAAMGLWVRAGSWSAQQLSDGFVPANIVRTFGGSDDDVRSLCDVGLWHEVENGYQFHDWDEYQPTREKVLSERESARKRMADLRGRSGEQKPNTEGSSAAVRPPRPDPSRSSSRTSSPRKPERPLPADWEPTEKHHELAKEQNVDIQAAVVAFKDHAETNDRRARDWNAAFRTWLRKANDYGPQRGRQAQADPWAHVQVIKPRSAS